MDYTILSTWAFFPVELSTCQSLFRIFRLGSSFQSRRQAEHLINSSDACNRGFPRITKLNKSKSAFLRGAMVRWQLGTVTRIHETHWLTQGAIPLDGDPNAGHLSYRRIAGRSQLKQTSIRKARGYHASPATEESLSV